MSLVIPSFSATGEVGGGQTRLEKSAAGGAAGVEMVFPQILYTRTFGDPDTLFVPLLDATSDAHKMMERLSCHGEDRANAVIDRLPPFKQPALHLTALPSLYTVPP